MGYGGRHHTVRIIRRVNNCMIHYIVLKTDRKFYQSVAICTANSPVSIPINRTILNEILGILNRPVSGNATVPRSYREGSVCHPTPSCTSHSSSRRVLRANVGIVSLLTPCDGNKGVNLFNNTNINGAILVRRLVRGVTARRNKCSVFANIKREDHRKGSLFTRVTRDNILSGATLMFKRVGRTPNIEVHITLANLAVTRRFHSRSGGSILLFVSGVFHFVRTNDRMSALLNHVPSTINCRPALSRRLKRLRREVTSAGGNSIASMRTVCIPTSSLTSPTPTAAFTRLSTAAMLDQGVTRLNVCPTISPLRSSSQVLRPRVVKRRRCCITQAIRRVLRRCGRLRSVVTVLNVSRLDRRSGLLIHETEGVRHFLSRPFDITRGFAKINNICMPLDRAVHDFGTVVSNRTSRCPRNTFFGINAVSSMERGTGRVTRTSGRGLSS